MGCFRKHLETSPFCWRRFCRCAINRLGHTFPQTRNVFTNGTLIAIIYLACSFADAMFSLGNSRENVFALCLSCMRRALPRVHLHISVFRTCASHPAVAPASSGTKVFSAVWKNQKGNVFFCCRFFVNKRIRSFRARLSLFSECPFDFDDFLEQIRYSRNSRHVCRPHLSSSLIPSQGSAVRVKT